MSGAFSVVLDGPSTDPLVLTSLVSNLQFKKNKKGGFASINFDLKRSLDARDLEPFSYVGVYDAETGRTAAAGRLRNPGKSASASGEVWDIAADGEGIAALQERTEPYILIDQRDDAWHQAFQAQKRASWSVSDVPGGSIAGVLLSLSETIASGSGSRSDVRYYELYESEQKLAAFKGEWDTGKTDTNSRLIAFASSFDAATFVIVNGNPNGQGFDTAGGTFQGVLGTDFTTGDNIDNVFVRYQRNTSSLTTADTDWAHLRNMVVMAVVLDRNGNPITTSSFYTDSWALVAEDVIVDALARWCPTIDVANASISASNSPLEQLAWLGGINTYDVFEQLLNSEPFTRYTWAVWERQENGRFRFEWRPLPVAGDIRYEVYNPVDFRRTGSDDRHNNHYWVVGRNAKGRDVARKLVMADTELDAIGKVRSRTLQYAGGGNFSGTEADNQAGTAYDDDRREAVSARLVVAGKTTFDRMTGRWVNADEIDPGYNMRLHGIGTKADFLNLEPTLGAVVMQSESTDYSADDNRAVIELNSVTFDDQEAIANLLQLQAR